MRRRALIFFFSRLILLSSLRNAEAETTRTTFFEVLRLFFILFSRDVWFVCWFWYSVRRAHPVTGTSRHETDSCITTIPSRIGLAAWSNAASNKVLDGRMMQLLLYDRWRSVCLLPGLSPCHALVGCVPHLWCGKTKWALPGRNSAHWILNYFKFSSGCVVTYSFLVLFGSHTAPFSEILWLVIALVIQPTECGNRNKRSCSRTSCALGIHRFSWSLSWIGSGFSPR